MPTQRVHVQAILPVPRGRMCQPIRVWRPQVELIGEGSAERCGIDLPLQVREMAVPIEASERPRINHDRLSIDAIDVAKFRDVCMYVCRQNGSQMHSNTSATPSEYEDVCLGRPPRTGACTDNTTCAQSFCRYIPVVHVLKCRINCTRTRTYGVSEREGGEQSAESKQKRISASPKHPAKTD